MAITLLIMLILSPKSTLSRTIVLLASKNRPIASRQSCNKPAGHITSSGQSES
ncbi:hypothetical protein ECANGB1_2695 [Enterospora canceri]|uniref:Uncharacterized protein n=1 Tax=Enterospora canceri TaxID=1081671 RepID=A0A1Y1S9V3_9MICR|nr:hypothetical protein ECANGB1_2695 [Enterospora canceri]